MDPWPERTETERLVLRCWTVDDAAALSAAIGESLEHLRPWMPWASGDAPPSVASQVELITGWDAQRRDGGDLTLGVFAGDGVVGGTGLHRRVGPGGLEIGYWIHVDHVRNGYATEVSAGLTDLAFTIDGIDRVEIHHDAANVPSGRVPARLGYRRIADVAHPPEAPAETGVRWCWRIRREEWVPGQFTLRWSPAQ
ncbi:MAG: N-acetyltransferase [Ilumatobacteraceae bacterium]|jgi:ribosomal-protein-serine acetyltransferase|nr:N-acetyltransferase [Ilumatobacteraceae bacterium]